MRRKDLLLISIDKDLDKLVHINQIKELNINFEKFKKNRIENSFMEARSEKDKKYIIKPDFNVKTEVKSNHSFGIGNCYYPISYERRFSTNSTIDEIEKNKKNFSGIKLCSLKVNSNYFKTHCLKFNINYNKFMNIYNGLISYLQYEEYSNSITNSDVSWAFENALEMYYVNICETNNDLKSIINDGIDYVAMEDFINECKKNQIIFPEKKLIIDKNKIWNTQNTYLDNRCVKNGKILTLKEQRKI